MGPTDMSAIFISHSSKDNAAAAELKAWLQQQGYTSLFLDSDPDAGIGVGDDWEQVLYRKLRQCRAVIALVTPNWLESKWCFAELTQAREKGKYVFIAKAAPCNDQQVLPRLQHVDLTKDPEQGFRRLAGGLRAKGLDPRDTFILNADRPPYPGLICFEEEDAAVFFGRDDEIFHSLEVLNHLWDKGAEEPRFVLFLGASGSGKSSLVRAGILPRLRKDPSKWLPLRPFRPQKNPLEELALVLAEGFKSLQQPRDWKEIRAELMVAAEAEPPEVKILIDLSRDLQMAADRPEATVLLCIDQAEELLGSGASETAELFLRLLRATLENSDCELMALATMRSDFLAEFQTHPALTGLDYKDVLVNPMPLEKIPEIVEKPAQLVDVRFEPGLVSRLQADTATWQALPLLAFTLRQLYEQYGGDGLLEIEEYDALGGLNASVRNAAEQVLVKAKPTPEQLRKLQRVFVSKLVRLNEDGKYARALAYEDNMDSSIKPLLQEFVKARLLVSGDINGRRALEVTHEALFEHWQLLKKWLDESRNDLRFLQRLKAAAALWNKQGKPNGSLWRPPDLTFLQDFLSRWRDNWFRSSSLELEFYNACKRAESRRKLHNILFMAGVVITPTLILFAFSTWKRAAQQEIQALNNRSSAALAADDHLGAVRAGVKAALKLKGGVLAKDSKIWSATTATLWQALDAAKESNRFVNKSEGILDVSLSPSICPDPLIASAGADGIIYLRDLSGLDRRKLQGHETKVTQIAFHPSDCKTLVTVDLNGKIKLWNWRTAEELLDRSDNDLFPKASFPLHSLRFQPGARHLAIAGDSSQVLLWRLDRGPSMLENMGKPETIGDPGVPGSIFSLSFHPTQPLLAFGGERDKIEIWDIELKEKIDEQPHETAVTSLSFASQGEILVTGDDEGHISLWRTNPSLSLIGTWDTRQEKIRDIHVSSDEQGNKMTIASTSRLDGSVKVWEIGRLQVNEISEKSPAPIAILHGHSGEVTSVYLRTRSDEPLLISGGADSNIKVWHYRASQAIAVYQDKPHWKKIEYGPQGKSIAALAKGGRFGILTLDRGSRPAHEWLEFQTPVDDFLWQLDSSNIILASRDKEIILWDHSSGVSPQSLAKSPLRVYSMDFSFSQEGKFLAIAAGLGDGKISLLSTKKDWTDTEWKPLNCNGILESSSSDISQIKFRPRTMELAILRKNGNIDFCALTDRLDSRRSLLEHGSKVHDLVFHPNARQLATAGEDRMVNLWQLPRSPETSETPLSGHRHPVTAIDFHPQGGLLASASWDGTVKLWGSDGTLLGTSIPRAPYNFPVTDVDFSPDGTYLAASFGGEIVEWPLTLDLLLKRGCNWLQDHLSTLEKRDPDRELCDSVLE